MKTTLNIDDGIMRRLKQEAARKGCTMSEIVETALRALLRPKRSPTPLPPLPTFKCGHELVDVANREALYEIFEDR